MRAREGALGLLALAVFATSCRNEDRAPHAHGSTSAVASSAPPAEPARVPAPEVAPTQPVLAIGKACRVLRVRGTIAAQSGEPIAAMTPLDGKSWLELPAGSELVARHTVSARELLLRGPGRVLPCRGGEEQVLLASGTFESAPGTGERPGAEVWIATPFGSARYGDAAFTLTVDATSWKIDVKSGTVWTSPPLAVRGRPADGRIGAGERASATGTPNPERLVTACTDAARRARATAEAVLSGGSSGLGERAASQLVARREARAACATAAAAINRVGDSARRTRLDDQITAADALWEAVPSARDVPLTVSGPHR